MIKKAVLVCLVINLLLGLQGIYAQTNIDSLINLAETSEIDSIANKAFVDLCWALKSSEPERALQYGEKGLNMAREKKFPEYEAYALKNIATVHLFTGDYDKAESFYQAAITIFSKLQIQKGLSSCYNNLGLVKELKGDFELALENYNKSLGINQKIKNALGEASAYNNIGNILQKQGNYSSSIEYYMKVLKIQEDLNDKAGIGDVLNNIGALYEKQNAYNEAIKNYQKALSLFISINDKPKSAMVLSNIGYILEQQKQYPDALEYYKQSLKIRQEFGDKQGIATVYLNTGNVLKAQNKLSEAFQNYKDSYNLYNEIGNKYGIIQVKIAMADYYLSLNKGQHAIDQIETLVKNEKILPADLSQSYYILSKAYANVQNFNLAYKYQGLYIELKDSLENEQNVKKLLQIQLKFEFDKKQKELEIIREKQRLNDMVALNNRNLVIFILFICMMAFILIGLLIYRSYKIKKQDNLILEIQKKEIQEKNSKLQLYQEELLSQNENLENQKALVMKHRDEISDQNQKITDSIQYAKRIQNSILSPDHLFSNVFSDYFIFYQPKDIVSGDFYWLKEGDNLVYLAVADCTGHGVPGAFMSLLGISFLNEIVESGISGSAEILSRIREKIKSTLHYSSGRQESKDGMDIALCVIDKKKKELKFSGAYHSIYMLKNEGSEKPEIVEIRGDKMPVGAHYKEDKKFTEHKLKISPADKFYLFTDGFIDQFGGAYDRKFLPKRFKEILINNGHEKMEIQKQELIQNLKSWMEEGEQIDDILVLGFSIDFDKF
ncbi:MAG: tetratricopeptide repeat protein [Bacteroidales bacterium]